MSMPTNGPASAAAPVSARTAGVGGRGRSDGRPSCGVAWKTAFTNRRAGQIHQVPRPNARVRQSGRRFGVLARRRSAVGNENASASGGPFNSIKDRPVRQELGGGGTGRGRKITISTQSDVVAAKSPSGSVTASGATPGGSSRRRRRGAGRSGVNLRGACQTCPMPTPGSPRSPALSGEVDRSFTGPGAGRGGAQVGSLPTAGAKELPQRRLRRRGCRANGDPEARAPPAGEATGVQPDQVVSANGQLGRCRRSGVSPD